MPILPMRDARAHCARLRAPGSIDADLQHTRTADRGTRVAGATGMAASIEPDRFRPSALVKASISDDGLVLLDIAGGLVLSSNAIGARIWQLLEERHARAEIATQLAEEYTIPLERARQDVAAFVAALIARGLVTADMRP